MFDRRDAACVAAIVLAVVALFAPFLDVGGFWWTDEARHAMNGVFLLDAFADRPFRDPYTYLMEYFTRFPSLSFNIYPPFFHFIESLVFALVGISELGARLAVMLFAMVGAIAWYAWARPFWGVPAALGSSLLFVTNPIVLLWGRSVMVDIPAVTMSVLSVLAFDRYLKSPSHGRSIIVGLSIAAMLLTKQTTAYMLPVLLLYAVMVGPARHLWNWRSLWGYAIVAAALAILAVHAMKFGSLYVEQSLGSEYEGAGGTSKRFSNERWLLHLDAAVMGYGWGLIALALSGLAALVMLGRTRHDLFVCAWIGLSFFAFSYVVAYPDDALRYTVYAIFPVTMLAARAIAVPTLPNSVRWAWAALVGAVVVWNGYAAFTTAQPFISGFERAAHFVRTLPDKGTILFCCRNDGNFTFHIRREDPDKDSIILRADKILVSFAVDHRFGVSSYVSTAADILQLLDKYGVGIIVSEDRDTVGRPEFPLLFETLNSDKFEKLQEISVDTNVPQTRGMKIRIYRYLEQKPIRDGMIVIPMPHLGRELRLRVKANEK
ncbi:MAG: glycosyltransferase family 39 protein [Proteobacteria bacterium]|nr:glycosyltransferase family 39 protein [Pseudomonadota bacterium]